MKKYVMCVVVLLLFSIVFSIPSQAMSISLFRQYFRTTGGNQYHPDIEYLGSQTYWEKQIARGNWIGENRPQPLMGDANIDGKVNATDALFALCFSVYGNIQTDTLTSGVKTPYQMRWEGPLATAYNKGKLNERVALEEHWRTYCVYNSPFFADVTKDCVVSAKDALEILKYCVGKAKNFPQGDFTSLTVRFSYYPWPTEYYPGFFEDLLVDITDQEFCEKHNFYPDVSSTDVAG